MENDLQQLAADADAAFNSGDFDKAEQLYAEVLQHDPDSVTALYAVGTIALQKQQLEKSLQHLKRAAELEPEAVDIAFNLATCLYTGGNRVGALQQLQRAAKYCQDDPVFCSAIAEMSIRLGEPNAALIIMSRLQKLTPEHQIIIANAHALLGNWGESANILAVLHSAIPDNPAVCEKLARANGQLRDYPAAIEAFENYLKLVTPTADDYLRFADLLLIAQNAKRCDQALDLAKSMGADTADLYILRARTARLRADYDAMIEAADQALARQSNHAQAWQIKAELANDDNVSELIEQLEIEIDNKDEVAKLNHHLQSLLYYSLAELHDKAENYEGAAKALLQANHIQNVALAMTNSGYSAKSTSEQFDEIIANYPSELFDSSKASSKLEGSDVTPIFIVGMVRSGTTLVERILGQNSNVFSGGEQESMEFVATHYHHEMRHGRLPIPMDNDAPKWTSMRQMYFDKLPKFSQSIITDKLPHNFRHVGLILKLFPDARIIQMHRAKADVCLSIYSHPFSMGHNYSTHWDEMSHFYDQAERLMAHWSSLGSNQILDINYEDLVGDPESVAKKLVEFCGFEWNQNYLEFHKSVTQSFTFSELQVREPIGQSRVNRADKYRPYIEALTKL